MSLVGRGLGRRGVAAALLVTAGLGVSLPIDEEVVGGGGSSPGAQAWRTADEALYRQVSEQWELIEAAKRQDAERRKAKPRPEDAQPAVAYAEIAGPLEAAPKVQATPPAAGVAVASVDLTPDAALVALLLQLEASEVRVTVSAAAPPALSEDDLAAIAAALASDPSVAI